MKLINKKKKMPQLTTEEQIFMVEKYIKSKSINHVRQLFSLRFNREVPCKSTIQCNVAKCHNFGTSLDKIKKTLEEVDLL